MTVKTKGSCEIYLHYDSVETALLSITTNIKGQKYFAPDTDFPQAIKVEIGHEEFEGAYYFKFNIYYGITLAERLSFGPVEKNDHFDLRVFLNNQFVSFYINDLWTYSYGYENMVYPEGDITVTLSATGDDLTLIDTRRVELADYREAIFVDYEQTSENAISSIIQQRPIEMYPEPGRSLAFTYASTRDTVNAKHIEKLQENIEDPSGMASDGLVYYSDVGIVLDAGVAEEVGFITRLYRMSEIDSGAMEAAEIIQNRSHEQRKRWNISARLDPRLEIGDIYSIDVIVTSTKRHIQKAIVVEDVSISMDDRRQSMNVSGRTI